MKWPRRNAGWSGDGFSAEISALRQHVAVAAQEHRARALVVMGLTPGAGATSIAVGLARSFAASGSAVVLIDANPVRPRLDVVFHVPVSPGTAEVLRLDADLTAALHNSGDPRLEVIAIGEGVPVIVPMAGWRTLFDRLPTESMVLVDGGTIDLPHAFALAGAADGVLLVAESGRSPWEAVGSAAINLARHNATLLGVALNKRRHSIPGFVYHQL